MTAISTQIRTLLVNRVNNLSSVGSVYSYEEDHPSRWPTVFVVPANLEGTFVTTAENRRIYAFSVRVAFPTGQNLPKDDSKQPVEYSEDVINQVVDDIINDIDENFELDGVTILFIEAADAIWGFIDYEGGKAMTCDIQLRIHTDFVVTS